MHRCKTILLTLALITGLGLVSACKNDEATEDKAAVEAEATETEGEEEAVEDQELPLEATGPVAEVNGEEIGADKFNEAIKQSAGMMPPGAMSGQLAEMMKERTVDRLVDIALIDKALEDAKIEVSDQEVDEELGRFKERLPDEETFKNFLEQRGLTEETMRENIHKDLQLREVLKDKYGTEVTEKDASEFYAANEQRFEHEDQVHARHILISVEKEAEEEKVEEAKKKAEEIAKEVKASGADFEAIAREKSEDPTAAQSGGDLGFFTKERMVPEFSEAAFAMNKGDISDPIRSDFGFHIIEVLDKKEAGKTSFEEAKEDIIADLERQKFRESMTGFLEELHEDAEVERKMDNIKVNVEEGEAPQQDPGAGGLPPELQQQIQQQMQQQQQQQQEGGGSDAPVELKLEEPNIGE